MGKGVVCPFFSNYLFANSICIEKEAVDKMIAHFVTAPFLYSKKLCFETVVAVGVVGTGLRFTMIKAIGTATDR